MHTTEQIEALVNGVFERISSGGREPVGEVFTEDARYEGAYGVEGQEAADNALEGADTITRFFKEYLAQTLSPFSQWADTIYPVTDGDTAIVEGASDGIATHDGSVYRNKYIWVMKFRDGKIELMREYFNISKWHHAIGPHWQEVVDRAFGDEVTIAHSKADALTG